MRSYIPFLSLRYLRHHKMSSLLGILGVTLGVGLVIVVVAVMDGFQERLRRSLLGSSSALVVRPRYDIDVDRFVEVLTSRVDGVLAASPVVTTQTIISRDIGSESIQKPCQVQGIDPDREGKVTDLARRLRTGVSSSSPLSLRPPATLDDPFRLQAKEEIRADRVRKGKKGIIVGWRLLDEMGARVGDELTLSTLGEKEKDSDRRSVMAERYIVTGEYQSGDYQTDNSAVLMDRRDALSYFKVAFHHDATEVRLRLADDNDVDAVAKRIRSAMGDLANASYRENPPGDAPLLVTTWKEENRVILEAVANERGLLLVITSFSFIVVAFLIGSTQSMLVVEKTREIGVLRSLGASLWGTSSVFLGNGFFIGTFGAAAGFGLGYTVANNVPAIVTGIRNVFGRDLFPPNIYNFSEVPIRVDPGFAFTVCLAAVGFSLLGAVLPALRAASLDPVSSLHHE